MNGANVLSSRLHARASACYAKAAVGGVHQNRMNRTLYFFLSVIKKIQYLTNSTRVSMKFTSHFYVLIACSFVAACGTVMQAEQTSFLSSYAGLTTGADVGQATLRAHSGIDPARVQLGEVIMQSGVGVALSPEERNQLAALLRQQLQLRVLEMPKNPRGQAAVLRAAITRVETVSPGLNTVGTLLLIGPLDRGGAAFEIEAVNPVNGTQLTAMKLGHYASISDLRARFSRLEPTEIAVRKSARNFVVLLADPIAR